MEKPLSFRILDDDAPRQRRGRARGYAVLGAIGLVCGLGVAVLASMSMDGGGLSTAEANGDAKRILRLSDPLAEPGLTTASISAALQPRADISLIRNFAPPSAEGWKGEGIVRQASFAPADEGVSGGAAADANETVILKTLPADPVDEVIELKAGDSLIERLEKLGIARSVAETLVAALNAIHPVADIPPGTRISVTIDRQQGFYGYDEVWPVYLSFPVRKGVKVVVEADDEGAFTARVEGGVMVMRQLKEPLRKTRAAVKRDERQPARRVISAPSKDHDLKKARPAPEVLRARGRVSSSLYAALKDRKVPEYIIRAVMRAFAYDVDFQRQVSKGTRFDVLYGPPLSGSSKRRKVLYYAALELRGRRHVFYRFTTPRGHTGFFDPQGRSAVKGLLRMPVSGVRISSGFGYRRHPVLGYTKLHSGIDFAAPRGTPIRAAGNGVIAHAGWRGSYGRAVIIRHGKTMTTLYAHMSRIARGIRKGAPVRQGQVIGYVGSTGRSTGPHLHFEVRRNGRRVNPLKVRTATRVRLKGKALAAFETYKKRIDAMLKSAATTERVARR